MKLYITSQELPPLSGIVVRPEFMELNMTHLTLASQNWETLYIDVEECIPEGSLRFLPRKCFKIRACCPEHPSLHQLHLLVELYPELDGRLRKAYMKGEGIGGILPEMWEHGNTDRRDAV